MYSIIFNYYHLRLARFKIALTISILTFVFFTSKSSAQITGAPLPGNSIADDTTIVFTSPRPLLAEQHAQNSVRHGWGLDVIFSSNGFGAGVFYQRIFSDKLSGFINLGISGARNTDEIEYYDQYDQKTFIPDKVNRLFMFPLTIGVQYRVFTENISESLRPFISAGVGSTFVVAAPYQFEFFQSLGHANTYSRFGGFIGVGANFGSVAKSVMGVNARYYFIPFGGNGIESIKGSPINDFGGLFLSLSVSFLN